MRKCGFTVVYKNRVCCSTIDVQIRFYLTFDYKCRQSVKKSKNKIKMIVRSGILLKLRLKNTTEY